MGPFGAGNHLLIAFLHYYFQVLADARIVVQSVHPTERAMINQCVIFTLHVQAHLLHLQQSGRTEMILIVCTSQGNQAPEAASSAVVEEQVEYSRPRNKTNENGSSPVEEFEPLEFRLRRDAEGSTTNFKPLPFPRHERYVAGRMLVHSLLLQMRTTQKHASLTASKAHKLCVDPLSGAQTGEKSLKEGKNERMKG